MMPLTSDELQIIGFKHLTDLDDDSNNEATYQRFNEQTKQFTVIVHHYNIEQFTICTHGFKITDTIERVFKGYCATVEELSNVLLMVEQK